MPSPCGRWEVRGLRSVRPRENVGATWSPNSISLQLYMLTHQPRRPAGHAHRWPRPPLARCFSLLVLRWSLQVPSVFTEHLLCAARSQVSGEPSPALAVPQSRGPHSRSPAAGVQVLLGLRRPT